MKIQSTFTDLSSQRSACFIQGFFYLLQFADQILLSSYEAHWLRLPNDFISDSTRATSDSDTQRDEQDGEFLIKSSSLFL